MMTMVGGRAPACRMTGENRRRQIVSVAAKLFSRKGFSGTTTKEIAEGAGVSEAMIFRHFATKSELYAAILDDKVRQVSERVQTQMDEAE
ncbi:MAG TPA: helix-turn-helix domain-containing protein, partial [Blastocatellia bacterium]